jgi:hypothetical protein
MLVGIHQPHYLPWARYFEKIAHSDVFIVLDNIQFNKNGWQNRNRIKTSSGSCVLTVPVLQHKNQNLNDATIDSNQLWRKKHACSILQSYSKSPHFSTHAPFIESFYSCDWRTLNEANQSMLQYHIEQLGIQSKIVYASDLNVPGEATERLVNLIRAVGGTAYYSGAYALDAYLDKRLLDDAGIELKLQTWRPPVYNQLHGEFIPDLSTLDMMMNCGPDTLRLILEGGAG